MSATAKADDWHPYRDDDRHWAVRHEWRRVERSQYAQDVAMGDVPGRVRDRLNEYRHGRSIERAQILRQDGQFLYYHFRINNGRQGDFYLDIAPNGRVLGRANLW